jgi:hypothetical protein
MRNITPKGFLKCLLQRKGYTVVLGFSMLFEVKLHHSSRVIYLPFRVKFPFEKAGILTPKLVAVQLPPILV